MNDYEIKHSEYLRKNGAECTVLLKSDGSFPLEQAGEIAAYGSGVRGTIKGGTGSGEVNSRYFVTIEEGLKQAGFNLTTNSWLDRYDKIRAVAHKQFVEDIRARAKENHTVAILEGMGAVMPEPEYNLPLDGSGDAAIYVVSRISGEGSDRNPVPGDILLNKTEIKDILEANKKYKKFMLVLNVGGPIDLSPVAEINSILVLSQLGVETGSVLADILLGRSNPSGKLTTTWSAWDDYCKLGEFGDINDTRYNEGIYVGYRYFDTLNKQPLFPFGFGLSYTTFQISNSKAEVEGSKVSLTAIVKNIGNLSGKEVLQAYVSCPDGRLDKPYQELCGFVKTKELKPEEEDTAAIQFDLCDIASYDTANSQFILEHGNYIVRVGNSSINTTVAAVIQLDETVVTKKVKSCCGTPDFTDYVPDEGDRRKADSEELKDSLVIKVDASDIKTEIVAYDTEQEIDPFIEKLSDEELVYVNIGAFNPKGGILGIIGNASSAVAGAAGETVGLFKDKGFPVLVMADGPAGLRISREYTYDKKGNIVVLGAAFPESLVEFFPKPLLWFLNRSEKKKKRKAKNIHKQYCTAIPIGTAVAQSFNIEFAKSCGDIVGDEMDRFGVQLWLAPALNIHRSIRCGRNFEYFSEDPLVSGKITAAITSGVQQHPGRGTTIKHYAANNQETNRYNNNSLVSERAMREIYLKGFGIAVCESQPMSVMTSYNLLNGEHTSERRDLIEDILRSEYGYQGIVVTDWIVNGGTMNKASVHPRPYSSKIAAAGGDLVMPGCKNDYKEIMEKLKSGKLSKKQLQINATRVYKMALQLTDK